MPVSRQLVRDFHDARISRNPDRMAQFLHDDVEWAIAGPVDLIPYCGQYRGKEATLDAVARVAPSVFRVTKVDVDEILIDGDRAPTFSRLAAVLHGTDRTITYQRAEFFQFRDDRIVAYRALLDSFDMAEQMLGHAINTSLSAPSEFATSGDRIAI